MNNCNKNKRDHTKCMLLFLFSTVLSTIFDMRYVHKTKQKVCPPSKVCAPLVLNTACGGSTAVCLFCDVVHESLVCPEQLKLSSVLQNNPHVLHILQFYSIFCIYEHFPAVLYDFEIHLFTPRTIEGLKHKLLQRFKHSLMLQKDT